VTGDLADLEALGGAKVALSTGESEKNAIQANILWASKFHKEGATFKESSNDMSVIFP
jgi:hypothetical protein